MPCRPVIVPDTAASRRRKMSGRNARRKPPPAVSAILFVAVTAIVAIGPFGEAVAAIVPSFGIALPALILVWIGKSRRT